jgi:hypothetical protein
LRQSIKMPSSGDKTSERWHDKGKTKNDSPSKGES